MTVKDLALSKEESAPRTYFKVLMAALAILIVSIIFSSITQAVANSVEKTTVAPIIIIAVGVVISTAVGIILPILYCKGLKNKLLTIFLLPTNYMIPVFLLVAYKAISTALEIISDFPAESFG